MKIVTTMDNPPSLTYRRQDGNTTKLIDHAIQLLFEHKSVVIVDHYDSKIAHEYLFERVLKRLEFEHPWIKIKRDITKRLIKIC
jgi:hypothetical protein